MYNYKSGQQYYFPSILVLVLMLHVFKFILGLLNTKNEEAYKMALTIARRYTVGAMFSCPDGSEVCNMFEKVCSLLYCILLKHIKLYHITYY